MKRRDFNRMALGMGLSPLLANRSLAQWYEGPSPPTAAPPKKFNILCRSHPQGRQAGGPAGRAGVEVRAGHQRSDRQDARPHRAADAARDRRRGDRVTPANDRLWHKADSPRPAAACPL
jgi:hypothetical protein